MREGWVEKKLSECFRLKSGDGLTRKAMRGGVYPVYGGNEIAGMHNVFNLSGDNVIVGRVGALCGNVRHITECIWLTDNAFKIVDFECEFDNRFLTHLLNYKNLRSLARQVAQPVISNSSLKDLTLCFPVSIPEQKRIVAILDEAFLRISQAVANAEKNLINARELFESYLNNIFSKKGEGWAENSLAELGNITSSKRIYKKEYTDSGIPFYRTKEVKEKANGRNITTELFISEERYSEIKQKFGVPQKGDILLTAIGTIGEMFVVDGQDDFYFKDGNVLWLKNFQSVNSYFLRYVLMSFVESLKRLSHGAAYNALPIEKLKNHIVYLPSADEQKNVVSKLDALQVETKNLETIYQKKLIALTEFKQSILQKAFAGELTTDTILQQVNG